MFGAMQGQEQFLQQYRGHCSKAEEVQNLQTK